MHTAVPTLPPPPPVVMCSCKLECALLEPSQEILNQHALPALPPGIGLHARPSTPPNHPCGLAQPPVCVTAAGSHKQRSGHRAAAAVVSSGMEVTLDGFEQALQGLASGSYILFKADWCRDCRRSVPAVKEAVAAAGGTLLVVDVARQSSTWKTPDHPLRHDHRFQLAGVPTLALWKDGAMAAKLTSDLENAPTTEAAGQLAVAFIKQHSIAA